MSQMVIEISEGIINHVYVDSIESYQVEITDTDDMYDPERQADRKRLEHLIKKGGMRDLLDEEMPEEDMAPAPVLDSGVFVLIKEGAEAKTENGRKLQVLDAAYLDGYLTASARISKFITNLYRKKEPHASQLHANLKPLLSQLSADYDQMCKRLNETEYDRIGSGT